MPCSKFRVSCSSSLPKEPTGSRRSCFRWLHRARRVTLRPIHRPYFPGNKLFSFLKLPSGVLLEEDLKTSLIVAYSTWDFDQEGLYFIRNPEPSWQCRENCLRHLTRSSSPLRIRKNSSSSPSPNRSGGTRPGEFRNVDLVLPRLMSW